MQVKIFRPAKSSMQSALQTNLWVLSIKNIDKSRVKSDIGWTSTIDTNSEVQLNFSTQEKAIEYAKQHCLTYQVIQNNIQKIRPKSYAQNFIKNR